MENASVIAVVVTYNRKTLLLQTLSALKMQTRPPNKIIVIDNASTDGTPNILEEKGFLDDAQVQYVRSDVNTGGAGGFRAGMARAMDEGADWIWVMDDDVAPTPDCLQALLKYRDVSECIHPRKYFPDGTEYTSEQFHDILTGGRYGIRNLSFKNGKNVIFTNTATFEGMLVSRRLVDKIGLPDEKYFICEDDMLFAIKASVHTNICHVHDAVINKLINPGAAPPWRAYYHIRNRFFLFRDACDYIELKPYYSERVKFVALQGLELARLLFKGTAYFKPAVSGFFDGLRYMRPPKQNGPAVKQADNIGNGAV